MSDKFYDALIDYKNVPDNVVLYDAACGLQYGIDEAIRRNIYSKESNKSLKPDNITELLEVEWIPYGD